MKLNFYPWVLDPNNPENPATRNDITNGLKDNLNNVEQIYVSNSELIQKGAGEWLVVVYSDDFTSFETGQKYSIVSDNEIKNKN